MMSRFSEHHPMGSTVASFWICTGTALLLVSCRSSREHDSTAAGERASFRPLSLVLVTIDTLRPDHLHCYGYSKIETPALDRIANKGVLFENAVAQKPLTPPSHASIFTGLYPNVHHARGSGGFVLPSSSITLAKILHDQGWNTAAFVSSAVLKKRFGFDQGFAIYDDRMPKSGNSRESREHPERRAGETVNRALQWLDTQSGKPLFLWVHIYDPHEPYDPPGIFHEQYKARPYDGEIAYADQQLSRLFEAIEKKLGLTQH